jgi:hypothetical protein
MASCYQVMKSPLVSSYPTWRRGDFWLAFPIFAISGPISTPSCCPLDHMMRLRHWTLLLCYHPPPSLVLYIYFTSPLCWISLYNLALVHHLLEYSLPEGVTSSLWNPPVLAPVFLLVLSETSSLFSLPAVLVPPRSLLKPILLVPY